MHVAPRSGSLMLLGLAAAMSTPEGGAAQVLPAPPPSATPASTTTAPTTTAPATTAPNTPSLADLFVEQPFAFTTADADRWAVGVRQHVEHVTGRVFTTAPRVRVVTRSELVEAMAASFHVPELATELSPVVVGFIDDRTGTVLLPAGNLRPIMTFSGVDPDRVEPIMKLVLANQFARVLHGQHVDTEAQREGVRSFDHQRAFRATSAGFGMLVQERVSEKLGAHRAHGELKRMMTFEGERHQDRVTALRRRYLEADEAGLTFFRAHVDAEGMTEAWTILEHPPTTYAHIRAPESYGDAETVALDAERLFNGLPELFDAKGWDAVSRAITPAEVGSTFASLGSSVTADVHANVAQAATFVLMKRQHGAPIVRVVSLIELRDEAFGPTFITHASELRDRQLKQVRGAGEQLKMTIGQNMVEPIPDLTSDESRLDRVTLTPEADAGQLPTAFVLATARRGRYFVQVLGSNADVPDATVFEAMARVLDRAAPAP